MNLLFVRKSNPQTGGVEMQMLRIALWLREHRMINSFLATDELDGSLAKLFLKNNFEVYQCTLSGRFYFLKACRQIAAIVKNKQVDFLQAHMFRESMVCRFVKMSGANVKHIFRIETYIDCSSISDFKKMLYHQLASLTKNYVDFYVANGSIVAKELSERSGVDIGNVKILFNGVEQFGLPDKNPIVKDESGYVRIAMVANFIRGKGHETLVDAIATLAKSRIMLKAFLFGGDMSGPDVEGKSYKQELINLVAASGIQKQVVFSGFSDDLVKDLQDISIVVLPSFSEGTPNTILEAMSARKLVIASDVGELNFMIENGVSGFIHKAGDGRELSALLERVVKDPSEKFDAIRENGFQRWVSLFSLEGMMRELSEIYKK